MTNKYKKHFGLILIIVGASALIIGHFVGLGNNNVLQICSLVLIIAGIPTHIMVTKSELK